jgi:enoyl-CoA hydratase/carnithine racemase
MSAETGVVTYEVIDDLAVVTMNRPQYRNAQNSVMTYALDAAFERAVDETPSASSFWLAPANISAQATTSALPTATITSATTTVR